jgi:hypothetical protein
MVGGGIHHHRQLLVLLWVCQQSGRPQSGPGGVKSRLHRRCPFDRLRRLGAARTESVRGRRIFAAAGTNRL